MAGSREGGTAVGGTGRTRRALDALYLWSGRLAAACLAGIALTVVAQIAGRLAGVAVDSTESAGFLLAGSTFFGLAHTFREGEHIRVTLLVRFASGAAARWCHLWALAFTAAVVGYATWWSLDLVWFSWRFGEISPGLLAVPFWIPRSAMALGLLVLCVALVDELVHVWRGETPSYVANAASPLDVVDAPIEGGDGLPGGAALGTLGSGGR